MISPEVFYLHIQGEQRGPYTIPQIDHLLNSGLIAEETLYWREGLEQWQPVTSLVRLRRVKNPWIKPAVILAATLVLGAVVYFFGSIALVGWWETNQHEFTEEAAYWRARGVIRAGALPPGAIVQFGDFERAEVELRPPATATVKLSGEVVSSAGEVRILAWSVPMNFDVEAREWNGGPAQETAP